MNLSLLWIGLFFFLLFGVMFLIYIKPVVFARFLGKEGFTIQTVDTPSIEAEVKKLPPI